MVRYFVDIATELAQATVSGLTNRRSEEIADSYTDDQIVSLLQNFRGNPTAPIDLQLALVGEPPEVRDQVTLAAAQQEATANEDNPSLWDRGVSALGDSLGDRYGELKTQSRWASAPLEFQAETIQAGFRNVAGAVGDSSKIKSAALTSGLQVLTGSGASPIPGVGLTDPNANLLKDVLLDEDALIERFNRINSNGEVRVGGAFDNLLAGSAFDQTTLGQITQELAETGRIDSSDWGDGFFISKESDLERRRTYAMSRAGALSDGGIISAGRWIADTAGLDPESGGYTALSVTVDLGLELSSAGGGVADEVLDAGVRGLGRRAINNRVLQGSSKGDFLREAGGNAGRYYRVDLPTAMNWLNGRTGSGVVDWLAETDSVTDIFRRTRGQYSPETLVRLADAADPNDVKKILMDTFAETGASPAFRSRPGLQVREFTAGRRLFGERPQGVLDLTDSGQSLETIDQMGQALGIPSDMRASWIDRMARAPDDGARYNAYADSVSEFEVMLISRFDQGGYRVNPDSARAMTTFNRAEINKTRIAIDDLIAMPELSWSRLVVDGKGWELPSAHLLSERAKVVSLPNMKDIQRATGMNRWLFEAIDVGDDLNAVNRNLVRLTNAVGQPVGKVVDWSLAGLGAIQNVWKATRLMRVAFPIRVVGIDEAARLDAAGHPSMWAHPVSYFSDMFHSGSMDDLTGELLEGSDEFIAARAGRSGRQPNVPTDRDVISKGATGRVEWWTQAGGITEMSAQERYVEAWRLQLEKYANDEVMQIAVRADSASDAAIDLLSTQRGRGFIEELMNMHPGKITNDTELVSYLESVRRRAAAGTGSNSSLLDFLAGGGSKSRWRSLDDIDLASLMDDFGPENLAIDVPLNRPKLNRYDRALEGIFEHLASRPTNRFSRSPVFRDEYRRAIVALAPLTDDLDGLVRAAQESGVFHGSFSDGLRMLRDTKVTGTAKMTPEMLDQLAKKAALEKVQTLLYDLTRSNQFFHAYQQVFPFGEAWKEGVGTWSRLIMDHPFRIERKVQRLGESATDAGVFHENDFGQTVFTIPGSEPLMQATTGIPFALEGGVRNLNMMGEGAPGVGPGVQYFAEAVMPEDPSWDWVRNVVMPYGDPDSARDVASWVAPSFARRILTGVAGPFTPEDERIFANTQLQVQRHMVSTGDWGIGTPDEIVALEEESRIRTAKLFLVRGMVQSVSPASPTVRAQVLGPDGELAETQAFIDRYYDLLEEDSTTALEKFMNEVGMANLLLVGKNTQATVHGGIPINGDGYNWVRDNPEVIDRHRQLFGFFAPQTPGGEFNGDAYDRSLREGLIEPLSPLEKLQLVNHRFASQIYRNWRTKLYAQAEATGRASLPPEHAQWLRELKDKLGDEWPGYATADTISKLPNPLAVIDDGDIERALADPLLAETPAGQGLAEYWGQRELVLGVATRAGILTDLNGQDGGWRSTDKMLEQRQWLIGVGDQIARDNPDFQIMWDQFLSRELRHDGSE